MDMWWLFWDGLLVGGIVLSVKSYKNRKNRNKQTKMPVYEEISKVDNSYGYSYGSSGARYLCRSYENALVAHDNNELLRIADRMIENHWESSYSNNYDDSMLYESVATNHPYLYPANGSKVFYRGLTLIEIFRNDNVEIRAQKAGKAPFTTPLPYKPK